MSCCLLGNHILAKSSLCFLNYVWSIPIQIVLPSLSAVICGTYKLYEIRIIVLFCRDHLTEWAQEEMIGRSPSAEISRLISQLVELNRPKVNDGSEHSDGSEGAVGGPVRLGGANWRTPSSEVDYTPASSVASIGSSVGVTPTSKVTVTLTAPR